jgi:hypothetical protein
MMARRANDPERELAEIHERRIELAQRRNDYSSAQGAAERVIAESADRRRALLISEARGDKPAETVAQVDRDRQAAEIAVRDNRERAEALGEVEREIASEAEAVIDAHPEHFIALALKASEAAEAERTALAEQTSTVVRMAREAQMAWSDVRKSYIRRGLDAPGEVRVSDLGGASSEIARSQGEAYPGGSRDRWESFCERERVAV